MSCGYLWNGNIVAGNKDGGGSSSLCIAFLNWLLPQICFHHNVNKRRRNEQWEAGLSTILRGIKWPMWSSSHYFLDSLDYFLLSLTLVGHCLTLCSYIVYIFLEKVKLLISPLQKCYTVIIENTESKDEDKTCP